MPRQTSLRRGPRAPRLLGVRPVRLLGISEIWCCHFVSGVGLNAGAIYNRHFLICSTGSGFRLVSHCGLPIVGARRRLLGRTRSPRASLGAVGIRVVGIRILTGRSAIALVAGARIGVRILGPSAGACACTCPRRPTGIGRTGRSFPARSAVGRRTRIRLRAGECHRNAGAIGDRESHAKGHRQRTHSTDVHGVSRRRRARVPRPISASGVGDEVTGCPETSGCVSVAVTRYAVPGRTCGHTSPPWCLQAPVL